MGPGSRMRAGQIKVVAKPVTPPRSAAPTSATTGCARRRRRNDSPIDSNPSSKSTSAAIWRKTSQITVNTSSTTTSMCRSLSPGPPLLRWHPRDLLVRHGRLPRERRHENRRLLQLVLAHALGVVGVGVASALVVGVEILDDVECWQAGFVEGHVIGGADTLDDVSRRTQIHQRREPGIEDRLRLAIAFHVEAECLAASRIVIQIDRQALTCGRRVVVLRQVGAGTEKSLLLAAPQRDPDRAARLDVERTQDAHRFHDS